MIVSIRLNSTDAELIKCFAEHNGLTVSSFFRTVILDYIEKHYLEVASFKEVSEEKE